MERHPLPLVTSAVRPFTLDREHTCLLLQDLHAPFADPEQGAFMRTARARGVTREFDEYLDALRLIAPVIGRLPAAFRERGIAVVYSCLGYRASQSPSAFQEATGWRWDLDGPDGAFPGAWVPLPGEPVFAKPGWGALMNPEFRHYLDARGITSVVVAGTMLEFGVRQTCAELGDLGLGALVVSDGVAGLTISGAAETAAGMAHGMTKLRSAAELLDLLDRLTSEERVHI